MIRLCFAVSAAALLAAASSAASAEDRYVVAHCMVCCSPSVAFSPDAKSAEREDLPSYLKPVAMPVPELERRRRASSPSRSIRASRAR